MNNNYRRYNPLLDEWVIVAANRVSRPWNGAKTSDQTKFTDSGEVNPLAPGGVRMGGVVTPNYDSVYVFQNDFPSFTDFEQKLDGLEDGELFREEEVRGTCRVICYHPDSRKSIAVMEPKEVKDVVDLWIDQFNQLKHYKWVQIFENKGAAVGCSNSHPHGQIWAGNFLPSLPTRKDRTQKAYKEKHSRVLLLDYLAQEQKRNERIVLANQHFTVLVPFWALWPYETMLIPHRHILRLSDLTEDEKTSLADILQKLMVKYDNIFECPFAFGMGWLGAPTGSSLQEDCSHWQLHLLIHPPLLRSATVPKFMAGYEILAEAQRDITAEAAAKVIREQPDVHYTKKQ